MSIRRRLGEAVGEVGKPGAFKGGQTLGRAENRRSGRSRPFRRRRGAGSSSRDMPPGSSAAPLGEPSGSPTARRDKRERGFSTISPAPVAGPGWGGTSSVGFAHRATEAEEVPAFSGDDLKIPADHAVVSSHTVGIFCRPPENSCRPPCGSLPPTRNFLSAT